MATYKVLQDIEAEDKFLGPLTLKQFIYAAITILCAYLSFLGLTKGTWIVAAIFAPVVIFGGFLAWPWGKDQPTEVWLLGKVRFFLKPRRRIWDQSGLQELVTIVAPKHIEKMVTNGLSQTEVKSRLQALANTIDSRGWAIKNVNVNLFSQPSYVQIGSDRLIDPTTLPSDVPADDITAMDDILDPQNNPTAHHFDEMIVASSQSHRQAAVAQMQAAANPGQPGVGQAPPSDYWFMNSKPQPSEPGTAAFPSPPVVTPGSTDDVTIAKTTTPTDEEEALLEQLHHQAEVPDPTNYHNVHVVQPASQSSRSKNHPKGLSHSSRQQVTNQAQATSTATPDPAILELANNDDLNVATIARQANQTRNQPPQDEVVISLR